MHSFDTVFDSDIAPTLEKMEVKRAKLASSKTRRMRVFNIFYTVISAIISVYAGYYFSSFWVFFGAALSLLIAVMLFHDNISKLVLSNTGYDCLRHDYKQNVVDKIVRAFGPEWRYEAKGKVAETELSESGLLHIGGNTKVEMDDLIVGKLDGQEISMVNLKTTSITASDNAYRKDQSEQSFNGLYVKLALPDTHALSAGTLYIVPKAKTAKSVGGLANMKFARDPNMTVEQQKAHNLKSLAASTGGYTWHRGMANNKDKLVKFESSGSDLKPYLLYADNKAGFEAFKQNKTLQALLSESFANDEALAQLSKTKSLVSLDSQLFDDLMQTSLTFAVHSGFVWALIPGFEDKFELDLDYALSRENIMKIHKDIQLALASVSAFLN